jgi:hypothetical protein
MKYLLITLGGILFADKVFAAPAVGKSTDTTPIKPGSRVNRHWKHKLKERDFTGRSKRFTVYNVDSRAIIERFHLHSIEFGNWVPEDERRQFLVGLDESLADLAKVFNVNQRKIGLGGQLAVAYGARGQGGKALATYWPGYILININREQGLGSFAHEYGHALDFNCARNGRAPSQFLLDRLPASKGVSPQSVGIKAMTKLLRENNGELNKYAQRLKGMTPYLRSQVEVWARSFETLVQSELAKRGWENDLLVKGKYRNTIYPNPVELKKARAAMMAYARLSLNKRK